MSDDERPRVDALRAHLDLDEAPDRALAAWRAASEAERVELLDRLLMETLLLDTLRARDAAGRERPLRRKIRRRHSVALGLAAVLLLAVGLAFLLLRPGGGYPRPRATGDFSVWSSSGEGVESLARGDRIVAGPAGARLALGGYCDLALEPGAAVVLEGSPGREALELHEGKVLSRITPRKGRFSVLTPLGALEVRGTEFATTVAHPVSEGEEAMARPRKSVLVTVLVISGLVGYQFGGQTGVLSGGATMAFAGEDAPEAGAKKIVAGTPRELRRDHPAWKDKGRIVGLARHCPGCEVDALDAEGNVVKSCAVAAGAKSYELQWLSPGVYTLRVRAAGYEPLLVKGLEVRAKQDIRLDVEFEGGPAEKTIEAGKPTLAAKDHPAWNERGRIVGRIRDCPGCEVDALDAAGKVVKSHSVEAGGRTYELGWLGPGTYTLRVAAKGYQTLVVENLVVKAKSDLRVDLEF